MLILSRKQGESIQIGDNITVTVLQIRPDRIKLGITAPVETGILRTEIQPLNLKLDEDLNIEAEHLIEEGGL